MIFRAEKLPSSTNQSVERIYRVGAYLGTGFLLVAALGLVTLTLANTQQWSSATAHVGSPSPVGNIELVARSDDTQTSLIVDNSATPAVGQPGPPLFFGYVEFDHDPNAPGGVPGFGPWQPSKPPVVAEATSN
jgi:hypothetical protein